MMDALCFDQAVDANAIARRLAPWLDDLERRIDPADEDRLLADWTRFADGNWPEPVFRPRRARATPPATAWPTVALDDALGDPAAMVLRQLAGASAALAAGSGALLCVRADYGTGILPSLFGVPVVRMAPELATLPGTRPLGAAAMPILAAEGPPPLDRGLWPLVRAIGAAFVACTAGRPALARHLHIYHPDLQGPMDVLEMAWGSECFTAFADDPALVHAVLRAITATHRAALADWDAVVPDRDPGYAAHWGMLHRGHVMLRDDSAMNLSPAMFRAFCAPYDAELLAAGGAIHACGRVSHFLAAAAALPGLHAVNLGQPELNRPEIIQRDLIDRGIPLIGMGEARWREWETADVRPRGLVHVG